VSVRPITTDSSSLRAKPMAAGRSDAWVRNYLRWAALADFGCATAGTLLAVQARFGEEVTDAYVALSLALPVFWLAALWLAGGYDARFVGAGSDEFRKVLNAGIGLTAAIAIGSYAVNIELSRGYLLIALPSVTLFDLIARYAIRKRLHRLRAAGRCMQSVVAVGHEPAVADLIAELHRDRYHGLSVVAACVTRQEPCREIGGVPVYGGLSDVTAAVSRFAADVVAVTSCPEIDGIKLRALAWELEKTGTELCVSPALLDVAGPRTTVRPTAGLTLLHVDHPQLSGFRLLLKGLFDRCLAAAALILLAPLLAVLAAVIWLPDRGPALFTQVRVGKNGRVFKIYKFRTMVVDAEQLRAELLARNDLDGVLFKLRKDPRVTAVGAHLRRWSIDELPQLVNVILGHMSLVGPRPALPDEASRYAEHIRRRLMVKPGLTGLWQVSGRSDLSWDESIRLDLRYVENWSFALDLQILWKTVSALLRRAGAYLGRRSPVELNPEPADVARLVRHAAGGDMQAWERLVDQFSRLIWSITAEYRLGESDAADVVQTTWLRLLEHIGRIEYPDRIGSWLAATARNECLRSLAARKRVVLASDDEVITGVAASGPEVDEHILADERDQVVRDALSRLPRRWQRLLELLMTDPPPSYAEISDQLNLPIGSIGPTRGRCLAQLRILLQAS
jgi:exopolysaccharide biosynthesis polyprenyl glycosylphosphotransferase